MLMGFIFRVSSEFPTSIVEHCLSKCLGCVQVRFVNIAVKISGLHSFPPSGCNSKTVTLDQRKVCARFGTNILRHAPEESMKNDQFLHEWDLAVPAMFTVSTDMLDGFAILREGVWKYVDVWKLEKIPRDRFRELFCLNDRWTQSELVAMLRDLAACGYSIEEMLLTHTRTSTTTTPQGETVSVYTSKLNYDRNFSSRVSWGQ
jgi:hypothetical protein